MRNKLIIICLMLVMLLFMPFAPAKADGSIVRDEAFRIEKLPARNVISELQNYPEYWVANLLLHIKTTQVESFATQSFNARYKVPVDGAIIGVDLLLSLYQAIGGGMNPDCFAEGSVRIDTLGVIQWRHGWRQLINNYGTVDLIRNWTETREQLRIPIKAGQTIDLYMGLCSGVPVETNATFDAYIYFVTKASTAGPSGTYYELLTKSQGGKISR